MVNSHFKNFLLGIQSLHKVFSNDSYDRLKFHILAWLGLNRDYAPEYQTLIGLDLPVLSILGALLSGISSQAELSSLRLSERSEECRLFFCRITESAGTLKVRFCQKVLMFLSQH